MITDVFNLMRLMVGEIATNCYILHNLEKHKLIVIDPGGDAPDIEGALAGFGSEVEAILITHAHYDHLMAVRELKEKHPEAVFIAPEGEMELFSMVSDFIGKTPVEVTGSPDRYVSDGEVLDLIGTKLKVIATPGHTAGSVCYYDENLKILFSGDTLFKGTCGRVDLPTGNARSMRDSLHRLRDLIPDDVKVLPGHMQLSLMGDEKKNNPYILHA